MWVYRLHETPQGQPEVGLQLEAPMLIILIGNVNLYKPMAANLFMLRCFRGKVIFSRYLMTSSNGQWRGALMFSLICVWINGWVNNREAGDLRRHRAHNDVIVTWKCKPVQVHGSKPFYAEELSWQGHFLPIIAWRRLPLERHMLYCCHKCTITSVYWFVLYRDPIVCGQRYLSHVYSKLTWILHI